MLLHKPNTTLVPSFPLERDHLPVLWIPFKFEELGNFCFGCGLLGHDHRNCQDTGVQNFGFFGKWLRVDNDEFQPGINLDNFLNPNQLAVEATPSASRSSIPQNQSSWIQIAKDSWDAMITREERGIRDEPVEVLEQCRTVILHQNDGTYLEKATDVLSKSLVSLNPSPSLVTSQLSRLSLDYNLLGSPNHRSAGPSSTKSTISKISTSQPPNKNSPPPHPLPGSKRKSNHLSPLEPSYTSPKKSKHTFTHTSPKLTRTPSPPLPKHSNLHRKKILQSAS